MLDVRDVVYTSSWIIKFSPPNLLLQKSISLLFSFKPPLIQPIICMHHINYTDVLHILYNIRKGVASSLITKNPIPKYVKVEKINHPHVSPPILFTRSNVFFAFSIFSPYLCILYFICLCTIIYSVFHDFIIRYTYVIRDVEW